MTRSQRGSSPIPYPGETIASSTSSMTIKLEEEAVGAPATQGQAHLSDNFSNVHDGNSQTTDVSVHQDGDQNGRAPRSFPTAATSGNSAVPLKDAAADDDDANLDPILAGASRARTKQYVDDQARFGATTWDRLEAPNVVELADRLFPKTYNHPHPGQVSMSPEMQPDTPSNTLSDDTSRQSPKE